MKNIVKSLALGALMSMVISTNMMANTVGIQCLNGRHTYTPRTFQMTKAEANEFCATKKTPLSPNPALAWTCPPYNYTWYTTDCPFNKCKTLGVPCSCKTLGVTCQFAYDAKLTGYTQDTYQEVNTITCQKMCDEFDHATGY